jgi:hypothetical protein
MSGPVICTRMDVTMQRGNKMALGDLVQQRIIDSCENCGMERFERSAMNAQDNSNLEQIDHKTSRSICDAIGERLQQSLRPEAELSQPLRQLVDQLRRRDGELH